MTILGGGEFSLILATLAISAGLDERIGPFVALYVLILAVLSPLLAANSQFVARRLPDWLLRRGRRYVREETISTSCSHLDQVRITDSDVDVCHECVELGDDWVELRLCTSCGTVACCDDSPHRHASGHATNTGHPIIEALVHGDPWRCCYVDEVLVRAPIGRARGEDATSS